MAATLTKQDELPARSGLKPVSIGRDLRGIAELVEVCFAGRLDSQGRAAVREMKTLAQFFPLLWILCALETLLPGVGVGAGVGYVWRDEGRLIGNASLYRAGAHPVLGPGWLIANVAVAPDYRRRGVARTMMHATLDRARRFGGQWAALQVETNNLGAVYLYDSLGFQRYEQLTQWEAVSLRTGHRPQPVTNQWIIRRREPGEFKEAMDFVLNRARRGAMAWTLPLSRSDFSDFPLGARSTGRDRWVLIDPAAPNRFQAVLWVEAATWSRTKMTLFVDPEYQNTEAVCALLSYVLYSPSIRSRVVRLEVETISEAVSSMLRGSGFRLLRTLYQMRLAI
ncbi:MAG: GNAT family N-acetyltransferase [Anaerolineae bacterium]